LGLCHDLAVRPALTPYADVNELLTLLVSELAATLGEMLSGLYLFGSLVAGDFDPGISDVDLVVATSTELNKAETERLRVMHAEISRRVPDFEHRLEVHYIALAPLRRYDPDYR